MNAKPSVLNHKTHIWLLVVAWCLPLGWNWPAEARDPNDRRVSAQSLQTLSGERLSLDGPGDHRWTAVVFISPTCPIANAYQPRLRELQTQFEKQGVRFIQVYVQPDLTDEDARTHVREYQLACPVVLDRERSLATALGAKVTPEVFVVDRKGVSLYRGRIDDQFAALGKKRPKPTRDDLAIALSEVVAGREVTVPTTSAVGCVIRY